MRKGMKIASLVMALMMGVSAAAAEVSGEITVVSREEGSGTRGAFIELTGVEEKNAEEAANSVSAALPTGGFVILDTELNDDLIAEGYARDVIRAVQDARKAAGLQISDRIALKLVVPAEDVSKVEQFKELVSSETLATSFEVTAGDELNVEVAKA